VTGFEDWLPTLLDLAGAPTPSRSDGISFTPTLLGRSQSPRPFLYREFVAYGGQQSLLAGEWKLIRRNLAPPAGQSASPTTELYHLASDPGEKGEVASKHPDVVARLMKIAREQHEASSRFPFAALDSK